MNKLLKGLITILLGLAALYLFPFVLVTVIGVIAIIIGVAIFFFIIGLILDILNRIGIKW